MLIQFFSDIHLEFGPMDPPKTKADVVVAAGDIGVRIGAIEWLASFEQPVIYVAGNHEFWSGDFYDAYRELRTACDRYGIHFLERNQVTIDDVTFFGCTLWSDFAQGALSILDLARLQMNDFEFISLDGRRLEPEDIAEYNQQSLHWLKSTLAETAAVTQVVVTHHAPSLKSWCFEPGDPMRYIYCNELESLIGDWNVALWIHGHTHCQSEYRILNTQVACNARGYYPHRLVDGFEPERMIEVNAKNAL